MIGFISQIDLDQLRLLLHRGWSRRISAVHIHHTWRPNHGQWRGQSTVEAIRRYHIDELGWSDIAQHLTIGPDGSVWTGRNLDLPPASASGHNGSPAEGPFMIEMIGDFDAGRDVFDNVQAAAAFDTVAEICVAFALESNVIRFHHEFNSAKSCPGTGLDLAQFRRNVDGARLTMGAARGLPSEATRAYAAQVVVTEGGRALEVDDAEPRYDAGQAARDWVGDGADRGFGGRCSPEEIEAFKSHVVNLSGGQLSDGGCYQNSPADVDELIARLGRWVAGRNGAPARIVFFAHGGLVDERAGLGICLRDRHWWLANDVYPVFFVWETGFFEVLEQEWTRTREDEGQRALFTDPFVEWSLGPTIGRPTWDRIKTSAYLASSSMTGSGQPGGAALFGSKLATWFDQLPASVKPTVQMHAVGHSAGPILLCHFLPALAAAFAGVAGAPTPAIETLAFLAPAVRVDLFKQTLMNTIGGAIGGMTMFTMERRAERQDNVIDVYRKSLLYFVMNACENPTYSTPILGLEESVRTDSELTTLFGLGTTPGKAEVVWSPSAARTGRAASQAIHHGDFDNDSPTMNAVLRRILAVADAQSVPCAHLPVKDIKACRGGPAPEAPRGLVRRRVARETAAGAGERGSRHALCIGIDAYGGSNALQGCVADAQSFAEALTRWGFNVQQLTNERATRQTITAGIEQLLSRSTSGDIVVIQYAGHGTQLPDTDGDESDGFDEAWVPYDYNDGEFVIDDDIGALFDRHRDRGVELVVFTDCCHSGTSTRFWAGRDAPQLASHSRYLPLPREIVQRYLSKRGAGQTGARFGPKDALGWEIHFAACQDQQSAYEHDGHGDFTRASTKALAEALTTSTTYAAFAATVATAFSGNPQQTPMLRAVSSSSARRLFGAARDGGVGLATGSPAAPADFGARLDRLTDAITALSKKVDEL